MARANEEWIADANYFANGLIESLGGIDPETLDISGNDFRILLEKLAELKTYVPMEMA